jgi:hypothetical protein
MQLFYKSAQYILKFMNIESILKAIESIFKGIIVNLQPIR